MRMRKWLAALLTLLGLAGPVCAGTITCVVDLDLIPANTYMVAGRLTMSTAYFTGGDGFGTGFAQGGTSALSDTGRCLCNSFARKPLVVVLDAEKNLAGAARLFEFNPTTRTVMAF